MSDSIIPSADPSILAKELLTQKNQMKKLKKYQQEIAALVVLELRH